MDNLLHYASFLTKLGFCERRCDMDSERWNVNTTGDERRGESNCLMCIRKTISVNSNNGFFDYKPTHWLQRPRNKPQLDLLALTGN